MISLYRGSWEKTLQYVSADLILTSPPYNIGSRQDRCDGRRRFGEFDPKSFRAITDYPDEVSEPRYQADQVKFLTWAHDHLTNDGVLVYNHKPRRRNGVMIHPAEWFLKVPQLILMEEIIWDRGSTHNHSKGLMWPTTERLYVFRRRDGRYRLNNTAELSQRSDLWRVGRAERNTARIHNAAFPLQLAVAAIEAWCPKDGTVCDPYAGSGTTAVAAEITGRRFIGSERLAKYHKVAADRIREVCSANLPASTLP